MGVEYSAVLIVGLEVDPNEFFLDEVELPGEGCGHAAAKGKKFCPECGASVAARKKMKRIKQPKPAFKEHLDWWDPADPGWYDLPTRIGPLTLGYIDSGYRHDRYFYGIEVAKAENYSGTVEVRELAADAVSFALAQVRGAFQKLDIAEKPKIMLIRKVNG